MDKSITPDSIIEFWYSDYVKSKWFNSTVEFDKELKSKYEGLPCPVGWDIVVKKSKNWYFLASSLYPKVKWAKDIQTYELEKEIWEKTCPKCWKWKLVVKKGKRWYFLACDRYPDCKYVEKIKKR